LPEGRREIEMIVKVGQGELYDALSKPSCSA